MGKLTIKKIYDEIECWNRMNTLRYEIDIAYNTKNKKYFVEGHDSNETNIYKEHINNITLTIDNQYNLSNKALYKKAKKIIDEYNIEYSMFF